MELNASLLVSCTCTRSITDCGLAKAIRLTDKRLAAERRIRPVEARFTSLLVFIVVVVR
jgi:hypothetical protein